ncbi:GlpG protein [Oceanospirillum multiglobuliferum]|uniref:Peptidase S54 rhomboid domain-containing protein n=1 Tax=Oceanospirillum multiglobuliferum TaxID=64969 RepID=A0A1T4LEV2_9GAMM|nr:rhomboid family intramembrane serine protease [Oceanospirillum multiglobuliferum]OPX56683.1 hypothetical protein BTE48_01940 [Oceanospirillum multiglobuliferum]SJZ53322.1 GlpG protein [Oceanospirillum multiglobuliferum]
MIKVLEVPLEQDLSELSQELWARRIGHRINEHNGHQEIWLADPAYFPELLQLLRDWQQGQLTHTINIKPRASIGKQIEMGFRQWPFSLLLIMVSTLITAAIFLLSSDQLLSMLTIVPVVLQGSQLIHGDLSTVLQQGELWRLLSPMFLHFGWLHLAFNCLWIWELGRLIETEQCSKKLLVVVLVSGLVANLSQYMMGDVLFGGLSGVVYGLLGYCWFWDKFARTPLFFVRKGVFIALMIWLVFCWLGGSAVLGLGNVANAAHIGGLIAGSLWAWIALKIFGEGRPNSRRI